MEQSSQAQRQLGQRATMNSQRGTSLVELALVLPILLLLVLGVGFFGRVLYHSILVNNAARAGTGFGMRAYADFGGMRNAAATDAQANLPGFKADTTNVPTATYYCRCPNESPPACGAAPAEPQADCLTGGELRTCTTDGTVRVYVHVETTYTFNTFGVDGSGNPVQVCLPGDLCIPSTATLKGCSIVRIQ